MEMEIYDNKLNEWGHVVWLRLASSKQQAAEWEQRRMLYEVYKMGLEPISHSLTDDYSFIALNSAVTYWISYEERSRNFRLWSLNPE